MNFNGLLTPLFVQIFLTFFLLFFLGYVRMKSIRRSEIKYKEVSVGQKNWPEYVMKVDRTFMNQFETPILFYVLLGAFAITQKADQIFVVMAWVFVICRLLHAFEYTGRNYVPRRFIYFAISTFNLFAMWIYFAFKVSAA